MKIAFIGLGAMGFPMAIHLAKAHQVLVWNRTKETAVRHAETFGTAVAASLEDCAGCEVILTILPTSREVEWVVRQMHETVRPGSLWIDCTSGDAASSRRFATELAQRGVEFVDAPVTGGTPGAEAGALTVMVGGSSQAFARAEEILRLFARKVVHVGDVGFGDALKAMNNVLLAANIWTAAECLVSMKKMGMDLATAFEVLNAGSGRSNVTENLLPRRLVGGEWPLTFKLALLDKDVRIAAETVHDQHLSTPMLDLISNLYTAARRELGEEADYLEAAKFVAGLSGEHW